jgi:hypothetical protein
VQTGDHEKDRIKAVAGLLCTRRVGRCEYRVRSPGRQSQQVRLISFAADGSVPVMGSGGSKSNFVPAGCEALALNAELGASILFEPCQSDVAQHRQVLAGRRVAHPRLILAIMRPATKAATRANTSTP